MRNYEVTFIVDPVLSDDEIKSTAQTYEDLLKNEDCNIIYLDEMGLRQLTYPINKRSSGVYYSLEFNCQSGEFIPKMELALRRDERIMRFLTVKLDKYGVKYNEDKRNGLFKKKNRIEKKDLKAKPRESAASERQESQSKSPSKSEEEE